MSDFRLRYDPNDHGLRFQDLTFEGNRPDLPQVPDGILGDQVMRSRMRTQALEPLSHADVLRDDFTLAELNDLNDYLSWNIWDVLAMRGTEGESGMIPRQDYELLAFVQEFYRYPEFMQLITDRVGAQGVIDIGASARTQIGTKINSVHNWCLGACAFAMGRCGLLAGDWISPSDYTGESNTILKFMQRVLWGARGDGLLFASQDRYRARIHTPELVADLAGQLTDFEPDSPAHTAFTAFNAQAQLLAFFDHYDCRLGLGDTGPYELPDGRLLIIRDLFVNEPAFAWSEACDGLPHAYTLLIALDADAMGLDEIRVNDLSTTFTLPQNYLPYITGGAVIVRDTWDTPMAEVRSLPLDGLTKDAEQISASIFRLYKATARLSRHALCVNGIYSYFIGMMLPHLRQVGMYEEVVATTDLWEIDQRVMNLYYEIQRRGFVHEVVPQKIFSGKGYLPFPEGSRLGSSKYRYT